MKTLNANGVVDNADRPASVISPGLLKLVVRLGLVSNDDIEKVSSRVGNKKLLTYLSELGIIDLEYVYSQIASSLGLEMVDMRKEAAYGGACALKLPSGFNKELALRHRCFPYAQSDEKLWMAMADPLDSEAISQLEFMFQSKIIISLSFESDIVEAVNYLFGEADDVQVLKNKTGTEDGQDDLEKASKAAPVVKFVNRVLADAIRQHASDVHFEPEEDRLVVRFRKDGIMSTHTSVTANLKPYISTRIKILANMNIAEKRRPQDGSFSISTGTGVACDVRVSSVPTPAGEKLVLRVLRSGFEEAKFGALGMNPKVFEQLKEALRQPDKLVVVTGPTGSGKTTTLYAALQFLRDGTTNIITVEDPVEYRLQGITQIQVDTKIGVTFASGLRSILRQDPDIIFVGEIRDFETAEVALQAAQTGHLVLSTLHTNTAPAAILRLVDIGVEPYVIAASLEGVLAQRLVRRLCAHCASILSRKELIELESYIGDATEKVRKAVGCERCAGSGYVSRMGIYSFLRITKPVRDLIRDGVGEDDIVNVARQDGFLDLWNVGLELVKEGITSLEELRRVVGVRAGQNSVSREAKSNLIDSNKNKSAQDTKTQIANLGMLNSSESEDESILDLVKSMKDKQSESKRADLKCQRVLLIDDDMHVRMVMERELRKIGFEILQAGDGLEGIKLATEHKPDLVLCDLVMPGKTGKDVVLALKSQPITRQIPIIMLTSMSDEAREIELMQAGADDFVSKGSSPKVVVERVKRFFRR